MERSQHEGVVGSSLCRRNPSAKGSDAGISQDICVKLRIIKGSISSLETKIDRLIQDVNQQSEKVDDIRSKISFVRGVIWTMGGFLALLIAGATIYVKFL